MRFLILLAIIGAALAVPRHAQRIIGGEPTTVEQYPFMANIQYGYSGLWYIQNCGGALVTTIAVLTSCRCVVDVTDYSLLVLLGTSQATSGGTSFEISSLIPHEEFNNVTLDNDVAIIRLVTPAVLSGSIGLARIAGPNYILPDGTPFNIVGWGDLAYGGPPPNELHHAQVNQVSQEVCAERYAELKTQPDYEDWPDVTERMICAAGGDDGGVDGCYGDTGGPLLHDGDIVVGVISWGYGCGEPGFPGVYARVGIYADWISSNTT